MTLDKGSIYSYSSDETKEIINGKVVKDTAINTQYDGKQLHIDKINNNVFKHYTIDNDTIKKLLNTPSNNIDLIQRLTTDFTRKTRKSKTKRSKTKRSKTKRSKTKRSKTKRSKTKRSKTKRS